MCMNTYIHVCVQDMYTCMCMQGVGYLHDGNEMEHCLYPYFHINPSP